MDQPAIYKYESLQESDEIRLLKLRPGKLGNIIWVDLETVSIRAGRDCYDAISYTWADENGDSTKCCSLKIGSRGLLLPITRNCDSVLRRVHKYTDRVWIDAVCIDQNNVLERGHQVDLMPQIYKSAVRTFAYVGEGADEGEVVLRNLGEGVWTPPHLLGSFFARQYFSRVWVVQEVALSKSITMVCGDTAVEWTELMQREYLRQLYTSSYHETFPTLLQLDRRHYLGEATLLDALSLGRSCNASDPRDKVFGLLGIVPEESRPPANYSLSPAEVYTQTVMHLLKVQKRGLYFILGNLCRRSDESRVQIKDLPSWVPDWTQREPTFSERVPRSSGFLHALQPIFEDNDRTGLFFQGQIVGTLKEVKEHSDIIDIHMYLFNSISRESRELPPAYRDRRVYVFSESIRRIRSAYAFVVARASSSGSTQASLSTLRDGERQGSLKLGACGDAEDGSRSLAREDATFGKASKELRDGSDGANDFELLGLVEIRSALNIFEIASRLNPLAMSMRPCTPPSHLPSG